MRARHGKQKSNANENWNPHQNTHSTGHCNGKSNQNATDQADSKNMIDIGLEADSEIYSDANAKPYRQPKRKAMTLSKQGGLKPVQEHRELVL